MGQPGAPRHAAPAAVRGGSGALPPLVGDVAAFTWQVFGRMAARDGDFVVSPLGIALGLGPLFLGAGGDTWSQLAALPCFRQDREILRTGLRDLWADFDARSGPEKACPLVLTTTCYGSPRFPWKIAEPTLGLAAFGVGFAGGATDGGTGGRSPLAEIAASIGVTMPPGFIDDPRTDAGLALVSMALGRTAFKTGFPADRIRNGRFTADGRATTLTMMSQCGAFRYAETGESQILELPMESLTTRGKVQAGHPECPDCDPFAPVTDDEGRCDGCGRPTSSGMIHFCSDCAARLGRCDRCGKPLPTPTPPRELTLVLVLPKASEFLGRVAGDLSGGALDTWLGAARPTAVEVTIPRFTLAGETDLASLLGGMGVTDLFDPTSADLSGWVDPLRMETDGLPRPALGPAVHRAVLEVTPQGAGDGDPAPTGGEAGQTPVRFVAEHPFLFFIREPQTGLVFFTGRFSGGNG